MSITRLGFAIFAVLCSIGYMASSEAVSKPQKSPQAAPCAKAAGKAAPAGWELIELDYRAGIKTLRQIADENDITHFAIKKRAKRGRWERHLSEKIQRKADVLVFTAAVSSEASKETKAAERAVVDANAHAIADVRLSPSEMPTTRQSRVAESIDFQSKKAHTTKSLCRLFTC